MFFNFGFEDLIEEYKLEIKIGTQIQIQIMRAPQEIIQQQFINLMQEVGNNQQPIRIRLVRNEEIWDNYNNKTKIIENYLQFANKHYMNAFKEEFEER